MNRASLFVPLAAFVALAGLLYVGFSLEDPHRLPSALVGKPFPAFSLPGLADEAQTYTEADLQGRTVLVNVWATWCPTCKAEHAELNRIAEETGLPIIGINYKDDPAAARAWLARYGDPYAFNVVDAEGRLGVQLGVYGAPETFLVGPDGVIAYKRVGDVNRRIWVDEIEPRLRLLGDGGEDRHEG